MIYNGNWTEWCNLVCENEWRDLEQMWFRAKHSVNRERIILLWANQIAGITGYFKIHIMNTIIKFSYKGMLNFFLGCSVRKHQAEYGFCSQLVQHVSSFASFDQWENGESRGPRRPQNGDQRREKSVNSVEEKFVNLTADEVSLFWLALVWYCDFSFVIQFCAAFP